MEKIDVVEIGRGDTIVVQVKDYKDVPKSFRKKVIGQIKEKFATNDVVVIPDGFEMTIVKRNR